MIVKDLQERLVKLIEGGFSNSKILNIGEDELTIYIEGFDQGKKLKDIGKMIDYAIIAYDNNQTNRYTMLLNDIISECTGLLSATIV